MPGRVEEEYARILFMSLSLCREKACEVRSAVSSLKRLKQQSEEACKGAGSVGEFYGLLEIQRLKELLDMLDDDVGKWLRCQGLVALVSALEVFLEDLLLKSLRHNSDLLRTFLRRLSETKDT